MKDFMTVLNERRSVRSFITDKKVSDDLIETLLRGAMQAPSAKNEQPWEFIVIDDRKHLDAIAEEHPYGKMLREAPLAILILGNTEKVKSKLFTQDLAAATQNMLLTATYLGLANCWLGLYANEDRVALINKYFNLPEHIIPFSMVALGYPKDPEAFKYIDRYQPTVVHKNGW